eukprot:jgi/Chlat1/3095/Chrsp21S03333
MAAAAGQCSSLSKCAASPPPCCSALLSRPCPGRSRPELRRGIASPLHHTAGAALQARTRSRVTGRAAQTCWRSTTKCIADPWGASVDASNLASQLFAFSLFPYLGFLYHLTRSKSTPTLALIGFYFLLVFVTATIPAGIYAKTHYHTALANVDWLHGSAESMLTVTNLLVVLGMRKGLREATRASIEAPSQDITDKVE